MTFILRGMRHLFGALALCLSPALPAQAAPCTGMEDLLAFIAAETGYAVPDTCPEILRSAALSAPDALRSQVGAYVPGTGQILLAENLDPDSALGRSTLLHELVHAAQFRSGAAARARCEGVLEAEAYRVQAAWLRAAGAGREALLTDWAAHALGRCDGDPPLTDY
jgi:hypothetical protein